MTGRVSKVEFEVRVDFRKFDIDVNEGFKWMTAHGTLSWHEPSGIIDWSTDGGGEGFFMNASELDALEEAIKKIKALRGSCKECQNDDDNCESKF